MKTWDSIFLKFLVCHKSSPSCERFLYNCLNVIRFVPGDFTDLRSCLLTTSYYFFSWLKHMSSYLTLQKHILFFFPPRKKNRPLFVFLLFLLTFVPYIWRSLIICSLSWFLTNIFGIFLELLVQASQRTISMTVEVKFWSCVFFFPHQIPREKKN